MRNERICPRVEKKGDDYMLVVVKWIKLATFVLITMLEECNSSKLPTYKIDDIKQ